MQSARESFTEANVNTWIGLIGSWLITAGVLLYVDVLGLFWSTNITVALCTVWSIARGYYIRRYFNKRHATVAPLQESAHGVPHRNCQSHCTSKLGLDVHCCKVHPSSVRSVREGADTS